MPSIQFPPDSGSPWFFVFFAAMWFGMSALLSALSGWSSMATHWRAHEAPKGERFRMRSASIGLKYFPVGYGNCVTVTVSDQGLGIALIFPFRFLSPPLFVPWSQVSSVTEGRFLFFRHVIVKPANHWARIKFYGQVASTVLAASKGRTRGAA
jgi:hypothetical protein